PIAPVQLSASADRGEYLLAYDTGPMVYDPVDDITNAEWGVRFTPTQACSLVYITLVTFQPAGPLSVSIYGDDGTGAPGTLTAGPFMIYASGDLSVQRVDFPNPVDVGNSEFHVVLKIMQANTPHPTFDDDGGSLRTTYHAPGAEWVAASNMDMVLRAYVRLYGADMTPPTVWHMPVGTAFSADGPVKVTASISDLNGINSAVIRYSTNGGASYQSVSMTLGGGSCTGFIPAFSAGTNVKYYVQVKDNSPAQNAATDPPEGLASPFRYTVQPGHEIKYDDGIPEQFWIESDIYDGNAFGVNFTPSSYPAVVSHLRVLLNDTTSVVLALQADPGGPPGDVIAGPFVVSADTNTGWADVIIPEGAQPVITSGSFFVVLYWQPSSPSLPGVATDTTAVSPNRSVWYDNAYGWYYFDLGNFMIRAAVQSPTGVEELTGSATPAQYTLDANYPNPFNPSTTINFSLRAASRIELRIHNILGQAVRDLFSGELDSGRHTIEWDGRDNNGNPVTSGVYFYTLRTNSSEETRKMLLLK
ncbi:MAG: T9SS type A sorting domain-containing protein, partial [candidate division Zixibacteria bacterium]|nr:T9SS type A sorting domain-containing protein [candidate division Zixibacteria bacterium]